MDKETLKKDIENLIKYQKVLGNTRGTIADEICIRQRMLRELEEKERK